jgi:hypothetical protein
MVAWSGVEVNYSRGYTAWGLACPFVAASVHPGLFPLSLWERAGVREAKRLPASAWHLA